MLRVLSVNMFSVEIILCGRIPYTYYTFLMAHMRPFRVRTREELTITLYENMLVEFIV